MKAVSRDPTGPAFSTLLRRYRLCAGLSQEALAERADVSVEAVSALERGVHRAPHAATIDLLATALQLDKKERGELAIAAVRRRAPRQSRRVALKALPSPLTRHVGRTGEIAAARSLLVERSVRLLTITGAGGVGKTRFALELARATSAEFEDGAAFVTLAGIRDHAHVAAAFGQCLERQNDDDAVSFDAFCARVSNHRLLLVLDNFEQVLAGAGVVATFLERCPRAVALVTSREALRLTGEHEFSLLPLDLDDAVELFTDRAQTIRPDLEAGAQRDSFVSICRRLEGLPLAIELAAARLRHYPAGALLARLSSRLDVLVSGARDSPSRQRTMRDAIDWSYQLLNGAERAVFQVASLFAGSGTLEALEALAKELDPAERTDELVASLVDKHLVSMHEGEPAQIRFEMLETIREYAYEQMVLSGQAERLQSAFASYYGDLARRAAAHLRGAEATRWYESIMRDYENIRASLRWALTHDRSFGLLLALDLRYFWSRMGYFAEAREWLEALGDPREHPFALTDPRRVWEALNLRALSYQWTGDHLRACQLFTEVTGVARGLKDEELVARSLNNLGTALWRAGDHERSRIVQEEALAIKLRQGDPWSIATSLSNLGLALRGCAQYDLALKRHRDALDLFRSTNDRWGELAGLNDIGDIYLDEREYALAARFYKASLDANASFRTLAADSFEGLAAVVVQRNRFRQAAVLGGAADTIHRETGRAIALTDRAAFDAACASARDALGTDEFARAWSEGELLSLAEGIELGRAIASETI